MYYFADYEILSIFHWKSFISFCLWDHFSRATNFLHFLLHFLLWKFANTTRYPLKSWGRTSKKNVNKKRTARYRSPFAFLQFTALLFLLPFYGSLLTEQHDTRKSLFLKSILKRKSVPLFFRRLIISMLPAKNWLQHIHYLLLLKILNIKNEIRFWINLAKIDACSYFDKYSILGTLWKVYEDWGHTHTHHAWCASRLYISVSIAMISFLLWNQSRWLFFLYLFFSRTNPWSTLTRANAW